MHKKDSLGNPVLQYLTDEIILQFTKSDELGDNILTDYRDINLKKLPTLHPYRKGVYDKDIFGSLFSNHCNCGSGGIDRVGRCSKCGTSVFDETEAYQRFARIESPVYFCTDIKYPQLIKWLNINFNFNSAITASLDINHLICQKTLELCQFNYIEDSNLIEVTDNIDDSSKCSFEGLLHIFMSYFPNKVKEFLQYINMNILVLPIIVRAPYWEVYSGIRRLKTHNLTSIYKNLIFAIEEFYKIESAKFINQIDLAMFKGLMRRFISQSISDLSQLLKTSKENLARTMQSNRLTNSGRCTIIPAPDLKIDEVYIPRHLMYEACREEFIKYLEITLQCSPVKAKYLYRLESNTNEIQRLFDDYINGDKERKGKYVIINRNPTLYELSMMACKVKLTEDYTMGLPLQLCKPFNADFDGDQMAFYVVKDESTDEIIETMSPKNIIYYKKNQEPVFMPTHEIMQGLIIATKCILTDNPLQFDDIKDVISYKKSSREFKYQTVFLLNGKETTLGREILSEYFGTNLTEYLNGFDKYLTASKCSALYSKLEDFEDRVERISKIQDFSLRLVTLSGATTPSISEMYSDIDPKYTAEFDAIDKNPILSDKEKEIKLREAFSNFLDTESKKLPEGVVLSVTESSRAKLDQLFSVVFPQLIIGPDRKAEISKTSLIQGMNPSSYEKLAIEIRALQDIKVISVPASGYITRQFEYLANNFKYSSEIDENNIGIKLPKNKAFGRTKLDGSIVGKTNSEDLVTVRSIVTSTAPKFILTSDMVSKLIKYKEGSSIGSSLITSLTEGLTSAGLALKHKGSFTNLDPKSRLEAKESCTVTLTDLWIIVNGVSGQSLYPKPNNFMLNYSIDNSYLKGDTIGYAYHAVTPSYIQDCIINLTKARGTVPKKLIARNKVIVSDCYAFNSGKIHYIYSGSNEITSVTIDGISYRYNPNCLYLFKEGSYVNKYDRICTGVLDLDNAFTKLNNYIESFYYFKLQFDELVPKISSELIEFLYVLITTKKGSRAILKGVINSIENTNSIYTTTAFGNAKKVFKNIKPFGVPFQADVMALLTLPGLFKNNENEI